MEAPQKTMNILIESRAFYPSIGGLEMMAQELGIEWKRRGHSVRVVTATPLNEQRGLQELDVLRLPTPADWIRQMRWADVFFQNGVSLRSVGYAVMTGCPIVFRHPDVLRPNDGSFDLRNELKRWATKLGRNVASSKAVAGPIRGETVQIPNTIRPTFHDQLETSSEEFRSGLLFVGRLVSIKGADVAIRALRLLHDRGIEQSLTICGGGPEMPPLKKLVEEKGLSDAVRFEGWTQPEELVKHYSKAEVTLVPSRYEPFGIVALEAIACGCPVVASSVHGLPQAVGNCGFLVEPDNPEALADSVERSLLSDVREDLKAAMPEHVEQHRLDRIAEKYLRQLHHAAGIDA
jgi:glycosyltransferase involved in cell wall biosynthesis